jgi:hypothetical protein
MGVMTAPSELRANEIEPVQSGWRLLRKSAYVVVVGPVKEVLSKRATLVAKGIRP